MSTQPMTDAELRDVGTWIEHCACADSKPCLHQRLYATVTQPKRKPGQTLTFLGVGRRS
jgi:hypothetical protein